MKFIPHGAAQEVTGTCHEIQVGGKRILLDCGLFQGHRQEAAVKNAEFSFDPEKDIDALILSHAHMDHLGRIPVLWKKGYRKPVFCTYATKDLAEVMLADAGYIQEKDEEYYCKHLAKSMMQCEGPLYTQEDSQKCLELFQGMNFNEWFTVVPGVRAMFLNAGHILGSAMIVMELTENGQTLRVGFSGDLGRYDLPIIPDPADMPPLDVLICESTYGNRAHEDISTARGHLKETLIDTAKRGGKLLIPAFSLERTQEIIYDLHMLWDAKEIPPIPIIIDSPLASKVTEVFMKHPEGFDEQMYKDFLSRHHNPFQFSLVKYTDSVDDSKKLNKTPGPMVIMAGSGMCEAGRIRHHLRNELGDDKNTVLAVGYMGQHTLGSKIVNPEVKEVKIFDEMYRKNAKVVSIDAYSGHADMHDLDAYVGKIKDLRTVILVHGELEQMEPFSKRLQASRALNVLIPEMRQEIELR